MKAHINIVRLRVLENPFKFTGLLLFEILCALVLFGLVFMIGGWYREQLMNKARLQVNAQVTAYGESLETAINSRFARLTGLLAFMQANPELGLEQDQFQAFVSGLYASTQGVRNFGVFPLNSKQLVYPLKGNEIITTQGIYNDDRPNVQEDVRRAIDTGHITLSGPYELRQGGLGLVARQAVYHEGKFWGLVSMVLDMPQILKEVGNNHPDGSMVMAVTDARGQTFTGEIGVNDQDPVLVQISLPEGTWQLAAIPMGGWEAAIAEDYRRFISLVWLVAALTMALILMVASRQEKLHKQVVEQTESLVEEAHKRAQTEVILSASEARYHRLTENAQDLIYRYALVPSPHFEYVSPSSTGMTGYSPEDHYADPQLPIKMVHPEDRGLLRMAFEGTLMPTQPLLYRWIHKDGRLIWAEQLNTLIRDEDGSLLAVEGIIRDVTERVRAEAELHRQMEENARRLEELSQLASLSMAMRQVNDRSKMAALLVAQTVDALGAPVGALALLEENQLRIEAQFGLDASLPALSLDGSENIFLEVLREGLPRFIEDLDRYPGSGDGPVYPEIPPGLQACMAAPLNSGTRHIGLLFLGFDRPHTFTLSQQRLVTAVAEMAGNALHRMSVTQTLERMIESRNLELESIYQVTSAASETLDIHSALQHALELTLQAVKAHAGAVFLLSKSGDQIELAAEVGLPREVSSFIQRRPVEDSLEGSIVLNRRPVILSDLASPYSKWMTLSEEALSFIGLPMRVREKIIGVLTLYRKGGASFDLEEMNMLSFLADHLALVVENARLAQSAEQHAVLAERSRMARELHDSVTQSLYSMGLYSAGAKEFAAQQNFDQVVTYIGHIQNITRQALREMRLMVYELRSPALETNGLLGALQSRLDSVERRSGITATIEAGKLPALPPAVEEHLYRVLLESFNNSLKHANAEHLDITINAGPEALEIEIADDGDGFNVEEGARNGGVGLSSMIERVEKLQGSLRIQSAPGSGTTIAIRIPLANGRVR